MAQADIRTSNAERDEAVHALGVHLSTGRLELDEYEERCTRATAARTRGDLEALFTDLPAPHPDLSSATPVQPGCVLEIFVGKSWTDQQLPQGNVTALSH